jgi:hypothetical protein
VNSPLFAAKAAPGKPPALESHVNHQVEIGLA